MSFEVKFNEKADSNANMAEHLDISGIRSLELLQALDAIAKRNDAATLLRRLKLITKLAKTPEELTYVIVVEMMHLINTGDMYPLGEVYDKRSRPDKFSRS